MMLAGTWYSQTCLLVLVVFCFGFVWLVVLGWKSHVLQTKLSCHSKVVCKNSYRKKETFVYKLGLFHGMGSRSQHSMIYADT